MRGTRWHRVLGVVTGCLLVTAPGCVRDDPGGPAMPTAGATTPGAATVTVAFEGAPLLRVEVARTAAQRATGLMHRPTVPEGTGMLFLFPGPSHGGFWMKNTLVPLSIAYVDGDRVVSTAEMTPCRADPCPSYAAAASYTAAVEAVAGFFPRYGVRAGTRMTVAGPTGAPD